MTIDARRSTDAWRGAASLLSRLDGRGDRDADRAYLEQCLRSGTCPLALPFPPGRMGIYLRSDDVECEYNAIEAMTALREDIYVCRFFHFGNYLPEWPEVDIFLEITMADHEVCAASVALQATKGNWPTIGSQPVLPA